MKTKTYKLRAECMDDALEAIKRIGTMFKNGILIEKIDDTPDVELHFETELALDEIQFSLLRITDGHVMAQTVALAQNYTGERDYSIVADWLPQTRTEPIDCLSEYMDISRKVEDALKLAWDRKGRKRETLENITVKGELIFELKSTEDWVNRIPEILAARESSDEELLFLDKNGNVFKRGKDFSAAKNGKTYPCKVYRLQSVAAHNERLK